MSELIEAHLPCPLCDSSDAYSTYDDGHGYCFSCGHPTFPDTQAPMEYTYEYLVYRGFKKSTLEFYKVLTRINSNGKPVGVIYSYINNASKSRMFPKQFYSEGPIASAGLYAKDKFNAGSAKAITITEGEDDALAVYEMLGSKYPVVSVQNAVTAKRDCTTDFEYLNSFDNIYLCFDNDEVGQKAAEQVATLFDFNKIYNVKLTKRKDAQEYHEAKEWEDFKRIWWNAKHFVLEGISSSFDEIDEILDEEIIRGSATYPFPTLQEMTYGPRTGEVVLFTAFSGIGKTEIIRAIEYHLIKTTKDNIGIIHLEEGKTRAIKGLVGYELEKPVHLPDSGVTKDDIKTTYRRLVERDNRVHFYSHFGTDDPDYILSAIRFLVVNCNCRYVFLDHITMVVTGTDTEDERKKLDNITTKLAFMTEELDFTLFMVSHITDDGKTRGSRNIRFVADLHIELHRNPTAELAVDRNKTYLHITKNRFASMTGPAGILTFNPKTFLIKELEDFGFPPVEATNDNNTILRPTLLQA